MILIIVFTVMLVVGEYLADAYIILCRQNKVWLLRNVATLDNKTTIFITNDAYLHIWWLR